MRQQREQRIASQASREESHSCNVCIPAYDGEAGVEGHCHKEQQQRRQGDDFGRFLSPCISLGLHSGRSMRARCPFWEHSSLHNTSLENFRIWAGCPDVQEQSSTCKGFMLPGMQECTC